MNELFIIFCFFVFFILFMSVGFIFKGKAIKGSCGGLGKLMGDDCEFCDNKNNCTRNT